MKGPSAILALGVALLAAGCGEKEENLDAVPETTTALQPAPPGASSVQVEGPAAKQLSRTAASAAVAPTFGLDPSAWTVRCKYPPGDLVSCSVAAGPCRGSVLITPTKVPAGQSAEGYFPEADASRVRCKTPRKAPDD